MLGFSSFMRPNKKPSAYKQSKPNSDNIYSFYGDSAMMAKARRGNRKKPRIFAWLKTMRQNFALGHS
jgi:hypothetical protein